MTKGFANCVAPRQRLWRLKHTTAANSWNFTSSIATSSSHGACSVANLFFPISRHTPSFPAGHFSNLMSSTVSTGPLMDLIAHLDLWETGSELAEALRYLRSSASPNFHGAAFGRDQLSKSDGLAPVSSWPLKLVKWDHMMWALTGWYERTILYTLSELRVMGIWRFVSLPQQIIDILTQPGQCHIGIVKIQ